MIYRKLTEHQIQSSFFTEIRLLEKFYPVLKLMFAVPNAGKRSYKIAAMLKAEGLRKGVLDVIFPVARKGFHGMAIEFKKPDGKDGKGGKLTEEQEEYIDLLTKEGWLVAVMTDAQGAIDLVKRYLDI